MTRPTNPPRKQPRVLVGLTGGIAAYKVVSVIRTLVERGCDVTVVPTVSALNFVGRATLEAISRNPVHDSLFDGVSEVRHVALGQSADVILIAPATAEVLSSLAEGRADSLLLTSVVASRAPMVIAPAMHAEMWENPATRANVQTLTERGAVFVGPTHGRLTGNDSGIGRLAEPDEIVDAVLSAALPKDLEGQRVLVTAGGTREPIDPVRFIGNRSTGAMGAALARAARDRGARVTLIAANLEVAPPSGVTVIPVSTTEELHRVCLSEVGNADVVFAAAAVSDFRVAHVSDHKLKKRDGLPVIELVPNPDILEELCRAEGDRVIVGFAAETDESGFADELASKATAKGVDFLVGNVVGDSRGFGNSETSVVVVDAEGKLVAEFQGSKNTVAAALLEHVSRQKASHT